ncbi:IS630 family transposase [Anabaena aphanizomenioides LEGE 00250]|uniref:IS630 family transposase n=1 Tax=Sphaerospermopsis aphanizomenoides LEGE 00250 TaxID=2777972 RepID=A0ABR9VLN4_9CYAN|nr:IS630 family transposase [Sphaerospermopsis aphanizomenoides]MBC5798350.1 IS630 family transposase [Sphaerospermopsis sp. LEGE 00249]MBE9239406.1 IS630 family transposase [Sphaerospermopsis aphanizomenoides LEGE 00250]
MQLLEDFIKNSQEPREIKRATAVKMLLRGYKHDEIMPILDVSSGFISTYKKAFFQKGIDGLKLKYKGSKGFLSNIQRAEVIEWLQTKEKWTLNELEYHIASKYGVTFASKQSYYEIFDAANISWKKTQANNPKYNQELVGLKKKEICELLETRRPEIESGELVVFMIDECHLLWGDVCGYVWGKTGERISVPVVNARDKQTYFGALDYKTKEFLTYSAPKGDSKNTINFLEYLRQQRPETKLLIIWDGASYHRSQQIQDYLDSLNHDLEKEQWWITCLRFAPNAPQQNPVEDIWLQAKRFVREFYFFCHSFTVIKELFELSINCQIFDFPKLHDYGVFS